MKTRFEQLIAALGTNPPTSPRAEAIRLREAFEALPKKEQRARRKRKGNYPYLEAAKQHLPHLNPTLCSIYERLLNSEDEGWDVSAGWGALKQGVPPSVVKDAVHHAQDDFKLAPELNYGMYLHHMLERERIERLPNDRKPQKGSHKRKVLSNRRKGMAQPEEQSQPQPEESPAVKTDLTLILTGSRRTLVALAAAQRNLTEETWLHLTIDRQAESDTGLTAVRPAPRPPVKAKPRATAQPAVQAKPKQETPKPSAAAAGKDDDKMPPLHERLRIVTGDDAVTIPEAIERLRAKSPSWVPESKELKAYISLAFSTHTKDLFQRVKRGIYRVRDEARGTAKPKPAAAKNGKVTNGKANGIHKDDLGILGNPFAPPA